MKRNGRWLAWWRWVCLAGVAAITPYGLAQGGYPEPADSFLNDFADVVTEADGARIREVFRTLRKEHGIEAAAVTIHSRRDYGTGDATIESFATNLFNAWGIGDKDSNNGALLLVAVKDREIRIEVGSAYGKTFDSTAKRIIDEEIVPRFKRGDMSEGIAVGARVLADELAKWRPATLEAPEPGTEAGAPPLVAEAPPAQPPTEAVAASEPVNHPIAISPVQIRRISRENQSSRPGFLHGIPGGLYTILGTVGALIASVLGLAFTRKKRCRACKGELVLVDAATDAHLLDAGQQTEDHLDSVDYQTWRCRACGLEQVLASRRWFSGYSRCGHCGYQTMKTTKRTIEHATEYSTGRRLVTYSCKHCSYHDERIETIPRRPSSDSGRRGGGGFGGSSGGGRSSGGGSFGGGRSSGGGASGRW